MQVNTKYTSAFSYFASNLLSGLFAGEPSGLFGNYVIYNSLKVPILVWINL